MKYTLCLNLQQHLDLAGNAARQCIGPDGGTCGAADLLAKELYQQAGSTVHNLGLLDKVICAVTKRLILFRSPIFASILARRFSAQL